MEKQKDEEIKTNIINVYSKYKEEESSDRRKVYRGQLCGLVFKWCKDHLYREADEMGVEIVEAVKRCAEKGKMPEEFLEDLGGALYYAKNLYYRNRVEGALREPRIIKEIKKIIKTEEANEGRVLTLDERVECIRRLIPMHEKTIRAHLTNMDRRFEPVDEKGNDNIESRAGHSLTINASISTPQEESVKDSEMETIRDALETVLNKAQNKMKAFYKALFTLRCIDNNIKHYQKLWPILDNEILDVYWKTLTVPDQYEIYMKYHPGAQKSTAEANASKMSKKFFADLDKVIKENWRE